MREDHSKWVQNFLKGDMGNNDPDKGSKYLGLNREFLALHRSKYFVHVAK